MTSATAGAATHPRGHRLVAAALACAAVAAAAAIGVASAARGPIATPTSAVRALGPMAPATRIAFELALVLPGQARLQRDLAAIADPHSPLYHHYIGARAFGERYGISTARLRRLEQTLAAAGVAVTESYPQRTALRVSATVATVERLLRVRIVRYAGAAGERWHAPTGAPAIPPALRGTVSGVTGLSTRPVWQAQDVPYGGLTAREAAIAYNSAPLFQQNLGGRGRRSRSSR